MISGLSMAVGESTQEMSAAAEEQLASLQEITVSFDELTEAARKMNGLSSRFVLN